MHNKHDPPKACSQTIFPFSMRPICCSDLSHIPTISTPLREWVSPTRPGGNDDINMEEELVVPMLELGLGFDPSNLEDIDIGMGNVSEDQILDFNDITQVARSRVCNSSPVIATKPAPYATVEEEVILEEPIITQPILGNLGAFDLSRPSSLPSSAEIKSYR